MEQNIVADSKKYLFETKCICMQMQSQCSKMLSFNYDIVLMHMLNGVFKHISMSQVN